MESRPVAGLALVAVLCLAGCTVGYQPAPAAPAPAEPPAEPDAHLGYYDGYWHNDTFDVDASDGLTDAQLEAVVSRAMARVQLLRGLRFESDVSVELVTRATFREEYGGITAPDSDGPRNRIDNAQYEALLLVGPDEDVAAVRGDNRGSNVLGFYRPGAGDIVLVSEAVPATLSDEYTLAHELVHALQDQHHGLGSIGATTLDGRNARNGLVEGDALVVQQAYQQRCASGTWQCVETEAAGTTPGVGPEFHYGVYFAGFVPYAEGPSFVRYHRDQGGWSDIDAMFDRPPTTSAELIHPATYDHPDRYGNATLSDRSDRAWDRVTVENGTSYATVGQGGLASMFAYTLRDDHRPNRSVIEPAAFFNHGNGGLDPRRPFTYDVAPATGWYGDRLYAYRGDGGTAYVWNVTFVDRANATEFRRGHAELLGYWGARRLDDAASSGESTAETAGRPDGAVWRFDGSIEFDGAVWVRQDGASLVVVKAPTTAALDDVHAPAATAATAAEAAVRPPATAA